MDTISVIQMERIRFLRSNSIEKISVVWGSFIEHLDKLAAQPTSNVSNEGWVVHYRQAFPSFLYGTEHVFIIVSIIIYV